MTELAGEIRFSSIIACQGNSKSAECIILVNSDKLYVSKGPRYKQDVEVTYITCTLVPEFPSNTFKAPSSIVKTVL